MNIQQNDKPVGLFSSLKEALKSNGAKHGDMFIADSDLPVAGQDLTILKGSRIDDEPLTLDRIKARKGPSGAPLATYDFSQYRRSNRDVLMYETTGIPDPDHSGAELQAGVVDLTTGEPVDSMSRLEYKDHLYSPDVRKTYARFKEVLHVQGERVEGATIARKDIAVEVDLSDGSKETLILKKGSRLYDDPRLTDRIHLETARQGSGTNSEVISRYEAKGRSVLASTITWGDPYESWGTGTQCFDAGSGEELDHAYADTSHLGPDGYPPPLTSDNYPILKDPRATYDFLKKAVRVEGDPKGGAYVVPDTRDVTVIFPNDRKGSFFLHKGSRFDEDPKTLDGIRVSNGVRGSILGGNFRNRVDEFESYRKDGVDVLKRCISNEYGDFSSSSGKTYTYLIDAVTGANLPLDYDNRSGLGSFLRGAAVPAFTVAGTALGALWGGFTGASAGLMLGETAGAIVREPLRKLGDLIADKATSAPTPPGTGPEEPRPVKISTDNGPAINSRVDAHVVIMGFAGAALGTGLFHTPGGFFAGLVAGSAGSVMDNANSPAEAALKGAAYGALLSGVGWTFWGGLLGGGAGGTLAGLGLYALRHALLGAATGGFTALTTHLLTHE
ncbi:MAG: hypothetical protein HYU64_18970 [Armatimonadetes bacterium]|nr:hypothetical protein [Armatimonadota bacterium]